MNNPTPQELGMAPFIAVPFETYCAEYYAEFKKTQPGWSEQELQESSQNAAGHSMLQDRLQYIGECERRLKIWRLSNKRLD
jgi:hypothetical protein